MLNFCRFAVLAIITWRSLFYNLSKFSEYSLVETKLFLDEA